MNIEDQIITRGTSSLAVGKWESCTWHSLGFCTLVAAICFMLGSQVADLEFSLHDTACRLANCAFGAGCARREVSDMRMSGAVLQPVF